MAGTAGVGIGGVAGAGIVGAGIATGTGGDDCRFDAKQLFLVRSERPAIDHSAGWRQKQ
jgi:hypothetical protein